MGTNTALATTDMPVMGSLPGAGLMDNFGLMAPENFDHAWRCAEVYAATAVVPSAFQGKPADCMVVLDLAARLAVSPFMLFQNVGMIHGRPSIEAKVAIALINERGPFCRPLEWSFAGDGMNRECTCIGTYDDGSTAEMVMTMKIAKAEGWYDKGGSKWKTMPDQMLRYRSASWLARAYCPGVLMGMYTADEAGEIIDVDVRVVDTPTKPQRRKAPAPPAAKPAPAPAPEQADAPELEPKPKAPAKKKAPAKPKKNAAPAPPAEEDAPAETLSLMSVLASAKVNAAHATDYCRHNGWIKTQTGKLTDMDDEVQNRIIGNVQGFADAIAKWRAEQN